MTDMRPDPYERPPGFIKDIYKSYKKLPKGKIDSAPGIVDFRKCESGAGVFEDFRGRNTIPGKLIRSACSRLEFARSVDSYSIDDEVMVYEHSSIPGKASRHKLGLHMVLIAPRSNSSAFIDSEESPDRSSINFAT